jgi:hercynylcysteine S-oxide lyase
LYGEEHPNAHLISPVVTHDLSLSPDLLLILGTSLRVHGLKVMVREFARAIHNRGGKVVFVNFTKPPESSWGDVIDYWVQWDCDAWVDDLQSRIPKLWEPPQPPRRIVKKTEEEKELERRLKPPAANPVALRDTKATGAYWTLKIMDELCRITGNPSLVRTPPMPPPKPSMKAKDSEQKLRRTKPAPSLTSSPAPEPIIMAEPMAEMNMDEPTQSAEESSPVPSDEPSPTPNDASKKSLPRNKRPRKSATGAVRRTRNKPSTLNPNHGRPSKAEAEVQTSKEEGRQAELSPPSPSQDARASISSILNSVKTNPRIRKRKKIYGDEVIVPAVGVRVQKSESELTLAPLINASPQSPPQLDPRPQPMEPPSPPPPGPVAEPISRFTNSFGFAESLRNALDFGRRDAKAIQDDLDRTWQWPGHPPQPQVQQQSHHVSVQWQRGVVHYEAPEPQVRPAEHEAALALAGLGVQERISSWMRWKFF